ncbi:hypothetical protein D3C71_1954360 [compost metagenome]
MFVGEHDDRPWLVAADQHHLLHHVAAGGFGVDQDHVGTYGLDAFGQVDGQPGLVYHLEAGFDQGGFQAADLLRGVVDQ